MTLRTDITNSLQTNGVFDCAKSKEKLCRKHSEIFSKISVTEIKLLKNLLILRRYNNNIR